jgi:hypothetical protein
MWLPLFNHPLQLLLFMETLTAANELRLVQKSSTVAIVSNLYRRFLLSCTSAKKTTGPTHNRRCKSLSAGGFLNITANGNWPDFHWRFS